MRAAPRQVAIFLTLSGILYAVFLLLDLTRAADSTLLKYSSILLCFGFSLTRCRTQDGRLVALALALTVTADWFLLVLERYDLVGVLLFCAVQLLYQIRLRFWREKYQGGRAVPRLIRLLPVVLLLEQIDLLSAVSLLYFVNLCCNLWEAWHISYNTRFAVGLTFFVCCDICVGAWNLGICQSFARLGMWLFYLPSQVCIVLSVEQVEQ